MQSGFDLSTHGDHKNQALIFMISLRGRYASSFVHVCSSLPFIFQSSIAHICVRAAYVQSAEQLCTARNASLSVLERVGTRRFAVGYLKSRERPSAGRLHAFALTFFAITGTHENTFWSGIRARTSTRCRTSGMTLSIAFHKTSARSCLSFLYSAPLRSRPLNKS